MVNKELVEKVKEVWIKMIDEEIKELEDDEEDDEEELNEDLVDKMKLKKKVLKCKSLQTIISLQRDDCWDLEGSASFIIECLSGEDVKFGGGWRT